MTDLVNILNIKADGFCDFALAMFIQSGILIVLLYAIDLLIRKHVRAVFRYCIWMLVFVKLILPVSLSSPVSMGQLFGDKLAINKTQNPAGSDIPVKVTATEADAIAADYGLEHLPPTPMVLGQPAGVTVPTITDDGTYMPPIKLNELEISTNPIAPAASSIPITWQAVVFLIWLVGVLVLSVLLFQRFLFVKILLAQSDRANDRLHETLQKCRKHVGVGGKIELRLSKSMLSPAVCGLSKPIILMPASLLDDLSEEKLRAVLIHELSHIKRGDLWVNFMQTILQIIYFYNPLLWFANAVVRGVREKAVDEMVLTKLGDEAASYSSTLIDIAEVAFSKPHFSLRLVGVVESKKALTSRIKHMLSRPFPKSAKLGLLGLATIIITAAFLLPMAKSDPGSHAFVIRGTVTDAETGQAIAGAKVGDDKYNDEKFYTTTDSNGNYSYKTWYEEHNVKAEAAGYKTLHKGLYTKLFRSEKEKVIDFALEKRSSEELKTPAIPDEYIGHWKGQAKIIVSWSKQKHLPIDIIIHSDGNVEGEIGDAELVNGKLVKKSWVYTKVFKHETPYRIKGDLQGEIIQSESIQRDSVAISIRVEDGKIDGGLATSGTKTGSKESMILSAVDVSLTGIGKSHVKTTNETKTSSFIAALPNGVTVEFIGVCDYPCEGKQWWQPDGSPLDNPPFAKTVSQNQYDRDDRNMYCIAYKLKGTPFLGTTSRGFDDQLLFSTSGGGILDESGNKVEGITHHVLGYPKETRKMSMRISVPETKDWTTFLKSDKPNVKAQTIFRGETFGLYYELKDRTGVLRWAQTNKHKRGDPLIRCILLVRKDQMSKEWNVEEWDVGMNLPVYEKGFDPNTGLPERIYNLFGFPRSAIKGIALQYIDFEQTEFKNISLRPGVKTEVEVEPPAAGVEGRGSVLAHLMPRNLGLGQEAGEFQWEITRKQPVKIVHGYYSFDEVGIREH
ncbi:MAG: M48 family metalloprotease, partial [Planctomycetes bacterium]|nr:M48 family metalloprotease [Planctomycetota bacterium]